MIWLRLRLENSSLLIAAVYRPPSQTDTALVEHLCSTYPRLQRRGERGFFVGDFNLHSAGWLSSSTTSPAGMHAEGRFADLGFSQLVQMSTHEKGNTLDLMLSDLPPSQFNITTHAPLRSRSTDKASDHLVLQADIAAGLFREPKTQRKVWRYDKADWGRLRKAIRTVDWDAVFTTPGDADALLSAFEAPLWPLLDRFIPSATLRTRTSDPSWWTPQCTSAVKLKQKGMIYSILLEVPHIQGTLVSRSVDLL